MTSPGKSNRDRIELVARHLGTLREEVVFLGGAATGLLITDAAAPEVRYTQDVDVIIELGSWLGYYQMEEALRSLGFTQRMGEHEPICRWSIGGIVVDVMPTDAQILGFSNRWYPSALRTATRIALAGDLEIRLISAPCFVATKIEAFYGRGKGDYLASHDMEDIVAVIDGRPELGAEIRLAEAEVKAFLAETFQGFLQEEAFLEALAGHLLPDSASQARLGLLMRRLQDIATPRV